MRNFFRVQQAERCPVCKKEWPGDYFVGERAMVASRGTDSSLNRQPADTSSAGNGHTGGSDEASEEDESEGSSEVEG